MFKIKEKAVNVPAFNLLLYEQYIHNPFVNPESMNTTYPEKCGTLHAQFFAKMTKLNSWYFFHSYQKSRS